MSKEEPLAPNDERAPLTPEPELLTPRNNWMLERPQMRGRGDGHATLGRELEAGERILVVVADDAQKVIAALRATVARLEAESLKDARETHEALSREVFDLTAANVDLADKLAAAEAEILSLRAQLG